MKAILWLSTFLFLSITTKPRLCNANPSIKTNSHLPPAAEFSLTRNKNSNNATSFITNGKNTKLAPTGHIYTNEWKTLTPQHRQRLYYGTSSPLQKGRNHFFFSNDMSSFRFKGFGLSLYKSFQDLESCGFALKIPLLGNWDWWDRQRHLPSLTLSIALYLPACRVAVGVSSSTDLQALKSALFQGLSFLGNVLSDTIYKVISMIYAVASIVLYPFCGDSHWLEPPSRHPSSSSEDKDRSTSSFKPKYNSAVQELLGCSMWYRWSMSTGFDTRVSYWHVCLPTLHHVCQLLLPKETKVPTWLTKNYASIGTDATLASASDLSLTGILSFSGFHIPQSKHRRKRNKARSTSSDTESGKNSKNSILFLPPIVKSTSTTTSLRSIIETNESNNDAGSPRMVPVSRGGNIFLSPSHHDSNQSC